MRLAEERAGRWNEVGDMYLMLAGMCSNYQVVIVIASYSIYKSYSYNGHC